MDLILRNTRVRGHDKLVDIAVNNGVIAPRLLVMRRGQIVARTTPSETVLCPKGWKQEVISFDVHE